MAKLTPQKLLESNSKQPASVEKVGTMLARYGFHRDRSKSSHVTFKHRDLGWIITLVQGTTDVGPQKDAARLCLQVEKHLLGHEDVAENFETASQATDRQDHITHIKSLLPDEIELVNRGQRYGLQSRSFKCLGLTLPRIGSLNAQKLQEAAERILALEEAFAKRLETLSSAYEAPWDDIEDGSLAIHLPYIDEDALLPPFSPGAYQDVLSEIDYIMDVLDVYDDHFLDAHLPLKTAGQFSRSDEYTLDNGMMLHSYRYRDAESGEEQTCKLHVTPGGRPDLEEYGYLTSLLHRLKYAGMEDHLRRYCGFRIWQEDETYARAQHAVYRIERSFIPYRVLEKRLEQSRASFEEAVGAEAGNSDLSSLRTHVGDNMSYGQHFADCLGKLVKDYNAKENKYGTRRVELLNKANSLGVRLINPGGIPPEYGESFQALFLDRSGKKKLQVTATYLAQEGEKSDRPSFQLGTGSAKAGNILIRPKDLDALDDFLKNIERDLERQVRQAQPFPQSRRYG